MEATAASAIRYTGAYMYINFKDDFVKSTHERQAHLSYFSDQHDAF